MKLVFVIGTRPEMIKLAPVIFQARKLFETKVCFSGQHGILLTQAAEVFDIEADFNLRVMRNNQSLAALSSKLITKIGSVFEMEKPDWLIVQGDTSTAFCAGLAAFYHKIKIAHVEAGLRTHDLASPFPEEANRRLLAQITDLHFAPTKRSCSELLREGVPIEKIFVTGNTVVDSIEWMRDKRLNGDSINLNNIASELENKDFILITCHRRENFGSVFEGFCRVIKDLCKKYPDLTWIFPVHKNPNIANEVRRLLGSIPNLHLIPPVDYAVSLKLISSSKLILTDSGGIQEEAPSFGVPVVVMREHTERFEGVSAGFATLAGTEPSAIFASVCNWLEDPKKLARLKKLPNPYGDGVASNRIVSVIEGKFCDEF